MTSKLRIAFLGMAFFATWTPGIPAQQRASSSSQISPIPRPPMGWSSWNSFSNTVNSQIVMEQAKAMASNGMQKSGYQYINIDEGWWLGKRDAKADFIVSETAWPAISPSDKPGDMSNIVRFIHSLGLKAGIYTDAGRDGCSMYPDLGPVYSNVGSEGHYEHDFLQFAKWGFDYVKVDWCGGDKEKLDPAVQYTEIARAIHHAEEATGHHLYFSICNWGNQSPWTWAAHIGGVSADIWRTSGDIVEPIVAGEKHSDRKAGFDKMLANFDAGIHPQAQQTGAYNDPDMMVLGMPGLSDNQNRTHLSLWAISGAPLLVGADLTKLSSKTLAMLTDPELIAIDQDALGLQATKAAEPEQGVQVWSKPLAKPGTRAVLLLNKTNAARDVKLNSADVGLADDTGMTARNVWTKSNLGSFDRVIATHVDAGDAVLLEISGGELPANRYVPSNSGSEASRCSGCEYRFDNLAAHSQWALIHIVYTNRDRALRFADLRVNDQSPIHVAFPPTGSQEKTVAVQALFDRTGATNVITLSIAGAPLLRIASIEIQ
jgi:hypothetical protein